ncbi:hypothetical protein I2501_35225 [Streptacidiphilus sp. NEAU-YB345]|uniref:LPXTG cell wall anchor domain-containing protein n=2 Tax=Streptacidiphilus fuscans TaxID=2789292 RepID=A0A931FH57_9ACTN|nr:hypothetical protein [Streptacidiphilus fuscans]
MALVGASVIVGAPSASAADDSFATTCNPPIGGAVHGTTVVAISSSNASPSVGDTVNITWHFVQAASQNPGYVDLAANSVLPTGDLSVGGAQSSTLAMTGTRTNPPIPKNSPMVLSDMTATIKLTSAGSVTFTPKDYNVNVMSTNTSCTPDATPSPGLTLQVGSGGGTTGGTSGGTSGGTTGGTGGTGGTTGGSTGGTTSGGTTSGGTTSGGTTTGGNTGGSTGGSTTGGGSTGGTGGGGTSFPGTPETVDYACVTPIGNVSAKPQITISAVKSGSSYKLTESFASGVSSSPVALPAGSMTPKTTVAVAGADNGTLTLNGPANSAAIPANTPIKPSDMTGSYTPGHTGKVTFATGVLTISALGTTTTCTPSPAPAPSLTLQVTAAGSGGITGGSASGGSSGSGSSGGAAATGGSGSSGSAGSAGTSGGLAETGGSNAPYQALGLVGGTILLLGAAVFVLTPWRRLRRQR